MVQIFSQPGEGNFEHIKVEVDETNFSFIDAKDKAKEIAREICSHPMILSWKNGKTGEFYPDYECGVQDKPFWIRYAEGRNANLVIEFNEGDYVFMMLKI